MHGPRLNVTALRAAFASRFARPCTLVARAPGRVNLIGEHTDYNGGPVLPIAIEQSTWVAAAPRTDALLRVYSTILDSERTWAAGAWQPQEPHDWTAYVAGVADLLRKRGAALPGFDLLIASDVPTGAGLSSSAALELATATALDALSGTALAPLELADLCRAAEHEYAGVPCGIMDQYISALGEPNAALLLDCRTRRWRHVPLALGPHELLVVDSGITHTLAAGAYAQRRDECVVAFRMLAATNPAVQALCDVTPAMIESAVTQLPSTIAARARHVVTEIERTYAAVAAIERCDAGAVGALLSASHRSLRDDFAVSLPEIDCLVECAENTPGVLGARMTGGGFGGSLVVLARTGAREELSARLAGRSGAPGTLRARLLPCSAGRGAELVYSAGG